MSKITNTFRHAPYAAILPTRPELSTKGRTVCITGGGSGIGFACAEAFAQSGAKNVIITSRTSSTLSTAKATLSAKYPSTSFHTHTTDIASAASVEALFRAVSTSIGPIDIFIANAGVAPAVQTIENMNMDDFRAAVDTNLIGTYLCSQHYVRHVHSSKPPTNPIFIHISTGHAHAMPLAPLSAYGITKSAASKVIDYLAWENPDIKVFMLHPGAIETNMTRGGGGSVKLREDVTLPASFCVWLASKEAVFLRSRFLWASWDVEELVGMRSEFEKNPHFCRIGLKFPGSRL